MVMSEIMKRKNKLRGNKFIDETQRNEIQSFYDKGNSIRDCQKIYGYCRATLIKSIKTRSIKKLSDSERKSNMVVRITDYRVRVKQKLVEYKGGKCGYSKYIGSLTFHHRDPFYKIL
jgi:hypothetical protein